MRRKVFSTLFIAILVVTSALSQVVLVTPSTKGEIPNARVEFLNAPVLFKEGSKSFQQVIASYRSDKAGKISHYSNKAKRF